MCRSPSLIIDSLIGMAVGIDLAGESAWGWGHPPNKNEMARRLALSTRTADIDT